MKKVNYLLIMLFAVALMSTSCCKDDPIVPDVLTVENLDGTWNFESLNFVDIDYGTTVSADNLYNTVQELSDLNEFYDFVQIDLVFTSTTVTISSTYLDADVNGTGDWSDTYSYTLNENVISVDGGYLEFEVMNAESLLNDEGVLELKLNDGNADMPEGGIYTF